MAGRQGAEGALRASEARQRFLLALSDRLRPLADPEAIQYEAARLLGEALGASRVGYAEIEPDGAHSVVTRHSAEAANRAKGEFLAVMSHELRTPLDAIGGTRPADAVRLEQVTFRATAPSCARARYRRLPGARVAGGIGARPDLRRTRANART